MLEKLYLRERKRGNISRNAVRNLRSLKDNLGGFEWKNACL